MTSRRRSRAAQLVVAAYLLASAASLVLALVGRWGPRRTPTAIEFFFAVLNVPVSASPVSLVVLVLISAALVRRQRVALLAVGLFQVIGIVLSIEDIVAWAYRHTGTLVLNSLLGLVGFAGIALVIWIRPEFPARLPRGNWLATGLVLAFGFTLTAGLTHLVLQSRTPDADLSVVIDALERTLAMPTFPMRTPVPPWLPTVNAALLSVTLVVGVWVFLRTARAARSWRPEQELEVRRLLALPGPADSLGWFATRRDKQVIFAADRRAAVAYRVVGGVCLAAGDPVGPPEAWPGAITAFLQQSRRYGWLPAVLGASEAAARGYLAQGLSVVPLGDEAVLRTDRFDLDSTSLTPVRRAAARAERAGVRVAVRPAADLDPAEWQEVRRSAARWRQGPERGFAMASGRLGDPADDQCLVVTARLDPMESLVGLLVLAPWGSDGLSLDLMRHGPDAPNGTTEAMVAALMGTAARWQRHRVSLNFAVLRGLSDTAARLGASPLVRLNSHLVDRLDRWFQLRSLAEVTQRYQPEWVTRYLCCDGLIGLVPTALAAARAEGFGPRWLRPPTQPSWPADRLAALAELRVSTARPAVAAEGLARDVPRSEQHRWDHLAQLRRAEREPWRYGARPEPAGEEVEVTGRVRWVRDLGGVMFVDLVDGRTTTQACFDRSSSKDHDLARRTFDIGDLVRVTGRPRLARHPRSGDTVEVGDWQMLAKALHPIAFGRLDDPRTRARQRSHDLIVHPEGMERLRLRSRVVAAIRECLEEHQFWEVETPILSQVAGGASARPFQTWSNSYGVPLTLRIAPELQLKRLLVAGSGPIFEIGRNFRNEGADARHNPEFTVLEAYRPGGDMTTMLTLTDELLRRAALAAHGRAAIPLAGGGWWDLDRDPRVVDVHAAVAAATGTPVTPDTPLDVLLGLARRHQVPIHDGMGTGAVLEALYGELVEPATTAPTYYRHFPSETSPLAAPYRSDPRLAERWDLVIGGMEIATAYSELTDPVLQRRRLVEQSWKAAAGDVEAMSVDEDFLAAMELGMPPSGGLGVGIDRLVMALTGTAIREVLAFPFVRPAG